MAAIQQNLIILLIGWASGISLYLTIAILGISSRAGWYVLPGNLEVLGHPLVIGAALIMYAVEFCADKVPVVDSAWDAVHTWIRPVGAMVMGYMAGSEHGLAIETTFAVLTGTIALDMHAVKSSGRLAINTSPEPVTNVAASVAEDASVFFLFWFFYKHPILATGIIILFLIGSFFFLRMMWRFVRKLFKKKEPQETPPQETKV